MPLNNVRVNCILLIIPATLILPKIFFFFLIFHVSYARVGAYIQQLFLNCRVACL